MRGLRGERLAGSEETDRAGGARHRRHRVSGMGALRAGGRSDGNVLRPAAQCAPSSSTSPTRLTDAQDAWWTKVDRSPRAQPGRQPGAAGGSLSLAGAVARAPAIMPRSSPSSSLASKTSDDGEHLTLQTQPTTRFHGSVAAMTEEVEPPDARRQARHLRRLQHRRSRAAGRRLQRVQPVVPHWQPHPQAGQRSLRRRVHLLRRRDGGHDHRQGLCAGRRRRCPKRTSSCLARAICSTKPKFLLGRPQRQKSKVSAFLSDFRDLAIGDYVVHVEHGIGQYQGLKEIPQEDGGSRRVHGPGVRRGRAPVCAAHATRPGAEVSLVGGREAGAEPAGHAAVAEDQGAREEGHEGHGRGAAEALRRAQDRRGPRLRRRHRMAARVRRHLRVQRDRRPDRRHRRREARHGSRPRRWTACSAAMSATAKPKSPCARRSRPSATIARSRCWRRPRCWPSSTSTPSSSASPPFPSRSRCSAASAPPSSRRRPSRRSRPARSTSSSARIACCRRT